MICYRDMCFCPFWEDCANAADCHRPLTEDVRLEAQAFGLPIDQFVDKPPCHMLKQSEYTVSFIFDCINKRSMVSRKSGEVDITTDATPEELMSSDGLKAMIIQEMARKTKQVILSIDIQGIKEKSIQKKK